MMDQGNSVREQGVEFRPSVLATVSGSTAAWL